jgi:hypothetical protein
MDFDMSLTGSAGTGTREHGQVAVFAGAPVRQTQRARVYRAVRLTFTREAIHSATSDASHPTARGPNRTGLGKVPSCMYWYSVLRARPVHCSTCRLRRIDVVCELC